ncbi:MAG: radical SAM protein [Elusimicrobia bacterium]|nr:radical SAM protein [Elusimicrobiota bacterium]
MKRLDEAKRRLELLPSTLDIFVTSRCNLACRYCSSRGLAGRAQDLPLEDVIRAVDWYAPGCSPELRERLAMKQSVLYSVNFAGGEPLLAYDVVSRAADHIRKAYPWMMVSIATNGTLLDHEKAESLLDRGVHLAVSLDGARAVNDAQRKFRDRPDSVFDTVVGHLARLSARRLARMEAGATMTAQVMAAMPKPVAYLKSLGFGMISLNFDLFEDWTKGKLAALENALGALKKHYLSHNLSFPRTSQTRATNVFFEALTRLSPQFHLTWELVLSPDGIFFPCQAACTLGLDALRIGTAGRGVDCDKLQKILDEARTLLPSKRGFSLYPLLDRYHYARALGLDPARMVAGGYQALEILDAESGCLARADRVLERLEMDKLFGDFAHDPRYRGAKRVDELVLDLGAGGADEPARARQAVDYCLYSPGRDKTLVLRAADLCAAFAVVEDAALYALLKARHLGKTLRVLLEGSAADLDQPRRRFIREHGLFLGVPGPPADAAGYALILLGRDDAGALAARAEQAARQGFQWAKLELRGASSLWSDSELDGLARGFGELERFLVRAALRGRGLGLLNLAWDHGARRAAPCDPRAAQELHSGLGRLGARLRAMARKRPALAAYLRSHRDMARRRSGFLGS